MEFELSKEQLSLKREVIYFAQMNLNDESIEEFSREKWRKCAEFGLIGMNIPQEYGGMGLDYLTSSLLLEGLGYGCEDSGFILP